MSTFVEMKSARRWLLWQKIERPGKPKPDKRPFYTDGTPRGTTDTPDDLARLVTYDEAMAARTKLGPAWHLGFALGGGWQGIDLDDVAGKGLVDLAHALPGYVETSPSGDGVHAIGHGRPFRSLGSNGSGIEAYSGGRFFTVTEKVIRDGETLCLAHHVENVLAPRYKPRPANGVLTANGAARVTISAQTAADLRSALNHIRSDDYGLWIEIGHALKPLGDTGRGLWLDWSAASPKFVLREAARKWDSFDPQHTGYQAVFAKARAHGWVSPTSNAAIFARFAYDASSSDAATVAATPFVMPAFFEIPPRPWVFGHWLLRGTVTAVVAPGGAGKSALMVALALSLATGRPLLGKTVWHQSQRVWLWNLEDDRDELTRQIAACSVHHRISDRDYAGHLFVDDATSLLCTATKSRDGLIIHEPVNAALAAEIRSREIDVLIVDPFVSSHRAEENDNGQIDAIVKRWARVSREANCSIVLVHHSRKLAGQQVDAEAARGASALGNAARSVLVLNGMQKPDATRIGILEEDRRDYFRVSNDKSNRAPAGKDDWFRRVPVRLGNGGAEGGDSVVAIEQWAPPEMSVLFDGTSRAAIQARIISGEWRAHFPASDWAGKAVADVIGADVENPTDRYRVKSLLRTMLADRELRIERRADANRKMKDYIVAGEPSKTSCDSSMW